jgi:beta-fructofuranosidase
MPEHRPRAHLRPETGWTNDPVGPIHWGGRTHLFHQYNPDGGYWDRPHWGHVVTDDLVHWQRRPVAISPGPTDADVDGCYSGCVVHDGDRAVMVYTGVLGDVGPGQRQATCLAYSRDEMLDHWEKEQANPVTLPPDTPGLVGFRDPFLWREDGRWWQLIGAGLPEHGGAVLLYASDDLVTWVDEGALLTGADLDGTEWTGSMWECPALVRIDGVDVLIVSVHDGETTHFPLAILGERDGTRFTPRRQQRMDLGPDLYAPCVLTDPSGRTLVWGWSWEARSPQRQREDGWAGALSLPRQLNVADDRLLLRALPETERLRERQLEVDRQPTHDGWLALGADGDALDLALELGPDADRVELRVRRSPDLAEHTTIGIDRAAGRVWLDRDRASLDPDAYGGRFEGPLGEPAGDDGSVLGVRVVVDRSLVEVFVGGTAALTARIYPSRDDSLGVEVVGDARATADVALRAWTLGSIWANATAG